MARTLSESARSGGDVGRDNQYTIRALGWITIVDAPDARAALGIGKSLASSASLLPSDVTASCVSRTTDEDRAWYCMMSGVPERGKA